MQELVKLFEEFIKEIASEDTLKVFRSLDGKTNVSEFDLAEELKMSINYVRNLLYGLHAHNLVTSTRKKDRQKGWYIYYWTFNVKHAVDLLIKRKEKQLQHLQVSLELRENIIYRCPDKHVQFDAAEALEHGFKCPECEQLLMSEDAAANKEQVEKLIEKVKQDLEVLRQPLELPQPEPEKKVRRKVVKKKAVKKKFVRRKISKKKIQKKGVKKIARKTKPKKHLSRKPTQKKHSHSKPVRKSFPAKKTVTKKIVRKPMKKKAKNRSSQRKKNVNMNVHIDLAGAVTGHDVVIQEPVQTSVQQPPQEASPSGLLGKIKKIRKRVGF